VASATAVQLHWQRLKLWEKSLKNQPGIEAGQLARSRSRSKNKPRGKSLSILICGCSEGKQKKLIGWQADLKTFNNQLKQRRFAFTFTYHAYALWPLHQLIVL